MRTNQFRFDRLEQPPAIHPKRRAFRAARRQADEARESVLPAAEPAHEAFADVVLGADAEEVGDIAGVPNDLHDPPLDPHDEAIFLLQAAAEVEHALMVQYLYAAYSLRREGQTAANQAHVDRWQETLLQIAREEMGHLASVQNLLLVLGGPLNLEREQLPFTSALYPFRFKLQPVSLRTLAKYVAAEGPEKRPEDISDADWELFTNEIQPAAKADNDGFKVLHVGAIFARLKQLLKNLPVEEFRLDTAAQQAKYDDWGYDPEYRPNSGQFGEPLLVLSVTGADATSVRDAAGDAVGKIGEQGEGYDIPDPEDSTESHFERFLLLYKDFKEKTAAGDWQPTWPLPINPNTTQPAPLKPGDMRAAVEEAFHEHGRITNQRTRKWAQLFNLRYRRLLNCLAHFLLLDTPLYDTSTGSSQGNRTPHGMLLIWTFDEMRRLKKLAGKLVQMPLGDAADPKRCGPPFELPYTLKLPAHEPSRWRAQRDVLRASRKLTQAILSDPVDAADPFLASLLDSDAQSLAFAEALANGQSPPVPPEKFQKVVRILEEAVRGFDVGFHKNFWRDKSVNEFVGVSLPMVGIVIDPATDPNAPGNAKLVRQISKPSGWMPKKRPKIPTPRIDAITQWIGAGCPDNTPAGQKGFVSEGNPLPESVAPVPSAPPVPLVAGADAPSLSFETDVKPLFREFDRDSMDFMFDLWKFEDVRDSADDIYEAVQSGAMPCDAAWPQEQVELFKKWIDQGKHP